LECVGLKDSDVLTIEPVTQDTKLPCPSVITAGTLFRRFVDLQGPLKRSTFKNLAGFVSDPSIKKE
jgi:hypothetical protein